MARITSWASLIFGIMLQSCATSGPPPQWSDLSQQQQQAFQSCQGEGEGALLVATPDLTLSGEFDWRLGKDLEMHIYGPLGNRVLKVKTTAGGRGLIAGGPGLDKVPKMALRGDGFLELNGYLVGLRPRELGCFLQGFFPREWLSHWYQIKRQQGQTALKIKDKIRSIDVNFALVQPCAQVRWQVMWPFVSSMATVCLGPQQGTGEITIDESQLRWRPL